MQQTRYFGTDGIRGKVGESLINPEFVMKLGWAAGNVLRAEMSHPRVLIGKDTRISGYMLESALEAGLIAAGVDVQLLGPMPTPAVAYLTHSLRAQAGVVISASHNPYYDNGVKIFNHKGMKLTDEMELAIEAELEKPMIVVAADKIGKAGRLEDAPGRYIEFCKSTFPMQLSLMGLKLVIDCANGAAYDVAPKIFRELGAEVTTMGCAPNGLNINSQCGATDVKALEEKVLALKADVGIALDGDGDRCIMVDDKGKRVDGDEMLCILAKDRATGVGSRLGIVGTVMSNLGLEQALNKHGITFLRAKVGDRYVLEELLNQGWTLGGEASGHIVDLDYTTTGDGIITALQVLRVMKMSNQSLAQLKQVMTKRPQILINIPVSEIINLDNYPAIGNAVKKAEEELKEAGRVLLRPSGTEPYVRVMVEGNDKLQVEMVGQTLAKTVESVLAANR